VHDVVPRRDGSFVGVCRGGDDDVTCDDIPLTAEDVAVWELNWGRFGRAVARALACEVNEAALGVPGAVQVASLSGEALPVVLTIQEDREGFRGAVALLVARLPRPFILLAPTRRFIDGVSQGLLANVKAGFFDLASHLTLLPSGALQSRQTGGELFSRYLPQNQDAIRKTEALRIFTLLRKLRTDPGKRKAPLGTVFELTVLDGLSQKEAAKRCRPRCVASLITARIRTIERRFGMPLADLRNYASDVRELESSVKGDRMRKRKSGARADVPAGDGGSGEDEDGAPKEVYVYDGGGG